MKTCPYCGGTNLDYIGADDGGGDYGTSLVETFYCEDCDEEVSFDVYDYGEDYEHEEDDTTGSDSVAVAG